MGVAPVRRVLLPKDFLKVRKTILIVKIALLNYEVVTTNDGDVIRSTMPAEPKSSAVVIFIPVLKPRAVRRQRSL